jgi:hypothetical protein
MWAKCNAANLVPTQKDQHLPLVEVEATWCWNEQNFGHEYQRGLELRSVLARTSTILLWESGTYSSRRAENCQERVKGYSSENGERERREGDVSVLAAYRQIAALSCMSVSLRLLPKHRNLLQISLRWGNEWLVGPEGNVQTYHTRKLM